MERHANRPGEPGQQASGDRQTGAGDGQEARYRGQPISSLPDPDLNAAFDHVCRVERDMIVEMARRGFFRRRM